MPLVSAALDADRAPVVSGDDHATPDGTGVRAFVHVADMAAAHPGPRCTGSSGSWAPAPGTTSAR